jgi:hypothetical protein
MLTYCQYKDWDYAAVKMHANEFDYYDIMMQVEQTAENDYSNRL